jgi:hypothetical protein
LFNNIPATVFNKGACFLGLILFQINNRVSSPLEWFSLSHLKQMDGRSPDRFFLSGHKFGGEGSMIPSNSKFTSLAQRTHGACSTCNCRFIVRTAHGARPGQGLAHRASMLYPHGVRECHADCTSVSLPTRGHLCVSMSRVLI